MGNTLAKCLAFIRRDFQTEISYKFNFIMHIFRALGVMVFFFFLSKLVNADAHDSLDKYQGDYFAFAMVGLALAGFFQMTLRLYSASIRSAQVTGCLEAMLGSQTDPCPIVLMSSLYGILAGTFHLALLFLLAVLFFHLDLSRANLGATALVFFLSTFSFVSFGVLSAAAIVVLKKSDPITWVFTSFGSMLGGAYFPVDIMPGWLQKVSMVLPIKYSLDALRLTLLNGYSITDGEVARATIILGLMSVILFPISLKVFSLSIRIGKKEGSLMQY